MEEKNATMLRICANIRQARKNRGWTQEEFAEKLGTNRTTYSEWERNFVPGVEEMMKISELTGYEITDLIYSQLNIQSTSKGDTKKIKKKKTINSVALLEGLKKYSATLGVEVFKKPFADCLSEIERLASEAENQ